VPIKERTVKERVEERVEARASARGTGILGRKEEKFEHLERWRRERGGKKRKRETERERGFMSGGHLHGLSPLLSPTIKAGGIPAARVVVLCIAIVVIVVVAARV